ncbi:mediator of RNA polymerase II transcription subunit 8 isoform X5 [Myotis myotis]|uniref:mediator of RNA polymerase II transcription subunit 8 isoform X5 n=1 Tax=Myotis myotis TaxID=51298 RepID=UPI00174D0642|nr:mediator of RNA polymerase II transcription subunit 8 isoform X5 [Myotis myotis]
MQREEKQLEASLDALLSQVADLKNSLGSFIYKLENEYDRLTWPSVLDSFALLSGQLNTLNKVLKHEKTPLFRNQVIIPLVLSPDRDEDLMRQTEGRVPVFSHEVVPDHLRTKPDPEVEEQEKQLTTDAARIGADVAQKQIQSLNKMCSNLLEKISKEERESESGGKMPSGIKTNIKSASMHPYQRIKSKCPVRPSRSTFSHSHSQLHFPSFPFTAWKASVASQ